MLNNQLIFGVGLFDFQKYVSQYFVDSKDGLLAFWGTGSGKTILAIACSERFREKHPQFSVLLLAKKSLFFLDTFVWIL